MSVDELVAVAVNQGFDEKSYRASVRAQVLSLRVLQQRAVDPRKYDEALGTLHTELRAKVYGRRRQARVVNRVFAFAFACVACGAAPRALHPMVLASAPAHVPTIAERRADVCGRSDLVTLEGPLVASGTTQEEHGAVKSVSARDASGRDVAVDARTLALVTRDAAFDVAQAREVVRRLWTSGKWDDVAVETTRDGDGIDVVFRVTPKREIANVFASDESGAAALRICRARSTIRWRSSRRGART